MTNSFTARKPWAAAVIGYFLGPVNGMLYLGRGKLAICYSVVLLLLSPLPFVAAHFGVLSYNPRNIFLLLMWVACVVGAYHCLDIARRNNIDFSKWYSHWYSIALFILLPFIFAHAFRTFLYEPFSIQSASMEPLLNIGDYVLVNKYIYDQQLPERGDIVTFRGPDNRTYIKRLIGLPGDTLQIREGVIYLNNLPVPRERLDSNSKEQDVSASAKVTNYVEQLPNGRAYNIRTFGDNVLADSMGVVPPTYIVPPHQYFFIGDNRDNSQDSRYFGPIPAENITGKASTIFWSNKTYKFSYRPIKSESIPLVLN